MAAAFLSLRAFFSQSLSKDHLRVKERKKKKSFASMNNIRRRKPIFAFSHHESIGKIPPAADQKMAHCLALKESIAKKVLLTSTMDVRPLFKRPFEAAPLPLDKRYRNYFRSRSFS